MLVEVSCDRDPHEARDQLVPGSLPRDAPEPLADAVPGVGEDVEAQADEVELSVRFQPVLEELRNKLIRAEPQAVAHLRSKHAVLPAPRQAVDPERLPAIMANPEPHGYPFLQLPHINLVVLAPRTNSYALRSDGGDGFEGLQSLLDGVLQLPWDALENPEESGQRIPMLPRPPDGPDVDAEGLGRALEQGKVAVALVVESHEPALQGSKQRLLLRRGGEGVLHEAFILLPEKDTRSARQDIIALHFP
mmetsp:Transcript_29390/g.94331  ORF Transcript_29390/g.94331 Transcript_29390/m.94331 type:complete len:248 (-) Transcript_29390:420-1163(-)